NRNLPAFGVYDAADSDAECVVEVAGAWVQKSPRHPTHFVLRCSHPIMKRFANLYTLASEAVGSVAKCSVGTCFEGWEEFDDKVTTSSIRICSRLGGFIPAQVREGIKGLSPQFDQILIVAEVDSWDSGTTLMGSCLIVGRKRQLFWLLAHFDTLAPKER